MNLIQIQDRLKGLPMQAVMAYANGSNPEVPPYVALGELNRRKQMEQQSAQPPQGSVKDNVEQSLMARNSAQQGILGVPHPTMQQAQPPVQMPQGAPTAQAPEMPTEDYADGGVVALPVRNEMFNYADGGIVAFAGGDVVRGNSGDEYYAEPLSDEELSKIDRLKALKKFAEFAGRNTEVDPETGEVTRKVPVAKAAPAPVAMPEVAPAPQQSAPSTAGGAQLPPQAPPVLRQAPQQIPTGGIASNPAGSAAAKFLAQSFQQPAAAIPEYAPPVQAPIGQKMEQYLKQQQEEDAAAQGKFKETEQQRAKSALWRNLIQAGEATRGGGGIGALLGGYGKSALAEEEAALGREAEQDKLVRERKFNNVKMVSELENLRRAEERGDAKAIYDSKIKIRELERQDQELKQRAASEIYKEGEANKRASLSHAGPASETRFINDWLARNPGKTYSDAYAAYKLAGSGTAVERQDLAELRALQKSYADLADPTKNFDKTSREDAARRLASVNKKLEEMSGMGEPAKVMSMADVAATAKSSGKTEQQVIEAAKARGYSIK
jgi:hypothetical protein